MIELDSCCFCFPLRTGSLIIGYLSLVSAIAFVILECVSLSAAVALVYYDLVEETAGYLAIGMCSMLLIFISIFLAFVIVLLVGLHKEKPGHVKAYLIIGSGLVSVSVVMFFLNTAFKPNEPLEIISVVVGIVLNIYYLLVIRSHYMIMKQQNCNNV